MGCQRFFESLFVVLFMGFLLGLSHAYKFYVGGKDGWVLNPSENYNHWAERNRFQVNDTLFFKYKKGSDSVLIVSKDDYYSCNTTTPIQSLTEGDSIFKFEHSGPFFFLSGNADSCNKGQKMIIVVMAVRHKTPPAAAPQSPSPFAAPPPKSPSPAADSPPGLPNSDAPVPAPDSKSGSVVLSGSVGLVLGCVVGVSSVILGGFVGMV